MHQPSGRRAAAGRYVPPEFTARTSPDRRTPYLRSELLSARTVLLGTPVDDASANDVTARLLHLERTSPDQDIELCINSPGGSFTAMTAILDTMRFVACDIRTVCLGRAGSAAALLLAAGTRGKRLAPPTARVTIEQPGHPEPVRGRPSDLAIHADELRRRRERWEVLLAEHTGQPVEAVRADVERSTVLDGPGALAYGIVDRLVSSRKESFAGSAPHGPSTGGW